MKSKVTLEAADVKRIAAAAEAEALKNGWPVTIAIVDDGGHLLWLQRLDGAAFMRTVESGEAQVTDAAQNGLGKLVVGALERSNVDIATEFTKLIVAQRAYTANTRVVTTTDEMLQETINMRR